MVSHYIRTQRGTMPLDAELGDTGGVEGQPLQSGFPPTVLQAMPRSDEGTDFVIKDLEEVGGMGAQLQPQGRTSGEMPLLCVCPTSGPMCFPSPNGDPHLASVSFIFQVRKLRHGGQGDLPKTTW